MFRGPAGGGLTLLALIMAGEAVFFLPFLLARVFRPTVLEVFGLSNLELGTAYGVYGIVAMAAYLVGGPLADRFNPRNLLAIALCATAAGGTLLLTIPDLSTLVLLYACWGVTTIALFWAPLIKATREWGGDLSQGSAFGLLDGGRGLLAAITGSIMVALFAAMLPIDPELSSLSQRTAALRQVITLLMSITAATAILIWFVLPPPTAQHDKKPHLNLGGIAHALAMPAVWLQALIILCAYVGFRAVDDFSLYANQVLRVNEVDAAKLGTVSLWVRPLAAVSAGYLADRLGAGRMTVVSFTLIALGSGILASGTITVGLYALFVVTVVTASLGIFALRGLYFAIMKEGRIPLAYTGSAVGVVSLIGYTPDVFMGPLMGWLLDRSPGAAGHQHVFWVVTGFAVLGVIASLLFQRVTRTAVN
jgi:nitrate/nitrite transporter NarK